MSTTIKTKKVNPEGTNETIEVSITYRDGKPVDYKLPEGWSMYAMDISSNNDFNYHYDPDFISYPLVGSKRKKSFMIPVRNDIGKAITAMDKTEDKRRERDSKCLVPGKRGKEIICREPSCRKAILEGSCPYADSNGMKRKRMISTEELSRNEVFEYDHMGDVTHDTAMGNINTDDFINYLHDNQPEGAVLPEILNLLLEGCSQVEAGKILKIDNVVYQTNLLRKLWKKYNKTN